MNLMINEIDTEAVREEELHGRDWLVAPITLMKSMYLHKGYVPSDHVANSVQSWNGIPLSFNHPRDAGGNLVSANSPDAADKNWLGHAFNSEVREEDGDIYIDGEAWFDVEKCEELGQEQLLNDLRQGNPISVSSSYFGDELPAGNYDGEHHENVRGNIRPDHIAILPNKQGRCSIEDGCVVGEMAANDLMFTNALTQARTPEFSGTESSSFTEVSKGLRLIVEGLGLDPELPDDVDNVRVDHLNQEERQQIAELSLLGDPDADNLYDLRLFQVVNHNNGNLNENALRSVIGGPGQRAEISDSAWDSAANRAQSLLQDEFDVEVDSEQLANAVSDIDREPPQAARDNAQMALDAREETGNPNDCGRETGWRRANQLVSNDQMSWDAISRMAQFARHESNKEQGDEGRENCGWMMWKAWGGDEGVDWAQRKMDERENEVSGNTDDPGNSGEGTTRMQLANTLSQARTPSYDGTETRSWADVDRSLSDIAPDADSVDDLTEEQRQSIAEHSLLGDPDAETFGELLFFPVVNPSTDSLNEGALDAVLSGRGSAADIPEDTLESARSVARNLLEDEFDRDLSENTSESLWESFKDFARNLGSANASTHLDERGVVNLHDQTTDGSFVTIDYAYFRDSPYFVVIHEDDGGRPGDIVARTDEYPPGAQLDNDTVEVDIAENQEMHAMLHFSEGGDVSDSISRKDGSVFMDTAFVGVAPDGVDVESSSHHDDPSYNQEFSQSDWVTWDGTVTGGQVVDAGGDYDDAISGGGGPITSDDDQTAYLIEMYDEDGAIEEESGRGDTQHVAHLGDSLSSWSDPEQSANEPAESGVGAINNMSQKTTELVENHGFDEENLPPEETECFDQIYNAFAGEEPEDDDGVTFESEEDFEQAVNETVEERVEEVLSNTQEQNKKKELAEEIIGNSEKFDEDDKDELVDSSRPVLEELASNVSKSASADFSARLGASANAADTKADGMPSLNASEHVEDN